jgi:hypothetical protein
MIYNAGEITFTLGFADIAGLGWSFNIILKEDNGKGIYYSDATSKTYGLMLVSPKGEVVDLDSVDWKDKYVEWSWMRSNEQKMFELTSNNREATVTLIDSNQENYGVLVTKLKNVGTEVGAINLQTYLPLVYTNIENMTGNINGLNAAIYNGFNN